MKKPGSHYLSTDEGKILALGIALGLGWIVLLIALALTQHVVPGHLLSMLTAVMVAGRAGGITLGQELGLPHWLIIFNATLADTLTVLFLYPLFVFSARTMHTKPLVHQVLGTSVKKAEAKKTWISRYGALGLLFFVWFPLHMTGPLVGSIMGYFMGLNPWLTMCIVTLGTLIAVICWTLLFQQMSAWVGDLSYLIPVFVITIALLMFWLLHSKHTKNQ